MASAMVKSGSAVRWFESAIGYSSSVADRIDRSIGVIRGVRVVGTRSRNGYDYSRSALVGAIGLYEGAKICINHIKPKKGEPMPERQFEQIWGTLRNVRWEDDGLVGDIHYNRAHQLTEQILEAVERFPESFGLSHDADGVRTEINGRPVIHKITRVYSVDIVADPASNVSLFESIGGGLGSASRGRGTAAAGLLEPLAVSGSLKEGFTWGGQVMSKNADAVRVFEGEMKKLESYKENMAGMGDEMLGAGSGSEVPVDESMDGGGDLESAFKSAVVAVLDDSSLDTNGKFAKIKAILKARETAMTAIGGDAAPAAPVADGGMGDSESDDGEDEENMQESKKVAELQQQLTAMQKELELRDARASMTKLLESTNREVTDVRVNALLRAPEAERKALLDSFPVREKAGRSRPAVSQSVLRESVDTTEYPKSYSEFKQRLS